MSMRRIRLSAAQRVLLAAAVLLAAPAPVRAAAAETEESAAAGEIISIADDVNESTEIDTCSADSENSTEIDTSISDTYGSTDVNAKETAGALPAEEVRGDAEEIDGLAYVSTMNLRYAECFRVDYYEDADGLTFRLLTVDGTDRCLVIPEGGAVPAGAEADETLVQIRQPLGAIYLVATSSMDFFDCLDALDTIALSGTKADDWAVENAAKAMEEGSIVYAGKYSAPDYETILAAGCDLAIESTMIRHTPEVKEMLEGFGIPVIVERSSYETHPLGRSEWIRFYGALLGREEEALKQFEAMCRKVDAVLADTAAHKGAAEQVSAAEQESAAAQESAAEQESAAAQADAAAQETAAPTVAYFYINGSGIAIVRKTADYVAKMIGMAGGQYIFTDLGDETALSTVHMQMEEFYATAVSADYLIYDSAIDGELASVSSLLDKSALLADFTAVKNGNVWCTTQSLFQKPTALADLIVDIHEMLSGKTEEDGGYTYLFHVE